MTLLAVTDIVKSVRDLPSLPVVVTELLASFEQEDVNISVLADKVSQDQALSAKTLRLANSSFYGLSRKVTSIQQAITVLGFDNVRALVSAASIPESFPVAKHAEFNFHAFWRHSIGTALCSKLIARRLNLSQNYAFVCGLLHDIGKLVLVTRFPVEYEGAMNYRAQHDCHTIKAEREVLGLDHALVGRLLAENWKFPLLMQKVIANHHAPEQADLGDLPSVVHAADVIVHALDLAPQSAELIPVIYEPAWASLRFDDTALQQLYRDTEAEFEEACQILTT